MDIETIECTTDKQAQLSGKQAADKLYIISILDKITEDIDKIRQIILNAE